VVLAVFQVLADQAAAREVFPARVVQAEAPAVFLVPADRVAVLAAFPGQVVLAGRAAVRRKPNLVRSNTLC
jgi:hypothetical protein